MHAAPSEKPVDDGTASVKGTKLTLGEPQLAHGCVDGSCAITIAAPAGVTVTLLIIIAAAALAAAVTASAAVTAAVTVIAAIIGSVHGSGGRTTIGGSPLRVAAGVIPQVLPGSDDRPATAVAETAEHRLFINPVQ